MSEMVIRVLFKTVSLLTCGLNVLKAGFCECGAFKKQFY